ncbi:MAG: hypothetical protein MUE41_16290, partial [Gemmatimonadaceae bacterium]|nr:hypothetical protein [Gemmatimonadaceae bacterium]
MARRTRPVVFLGPVEVSGYYAQLHQGFEALGCEVVRLSMIPDERAYAPGTPFWPAALAMRLERASVSRLRATPGSLAGRLLSKAASIALMVLAVRVILRCNVLVYGFGASITWRPALEYRFARLLKRRIVCIFHGSDSRPPYLDGHALAGDRGVDPADMARLVRERHALVRRVDAAADVVVDNPFGAHFHGRRCVTLHAIGVPFARVPA